MSIKNRFSNVAAALGEVRKPGGLKRLAVATAHSVRSNRRMTAVLLTVGAAPAFADTAMDVAAPLATIAAAVVGKNLIGPAWTGLKYVGKAWAKM